MRVYLTSEFLKELTNCDSHIIKKALAQIKKLEQNPEAGKPLKYLHKNHRSIRIKPYRIIYSLEGENVTLETIKHRKDAY